MEDVLITIAILASMLLAASYYIGGKQWLQDLKKETKGKKGK